MKEPVPVEIGQRYEDADKRYPGRVLEVLGFNQDPPATKAYVLSLSSKRKVWIQIKRLQSPKFYRLLGKKKTEGQE